MQTPFRNIVLRCYSKLSHYLEWQDPENARALHADGGYLPVPRADRTAPFSAQNYFIAAAG